jgi:peptidoglycan-associated lipoprotein
MQITKTVSLVVGIIAILSLSACSTVGKQSQSGPMGDKVVSANAAAAGAGADSQGIAGQDQFAGTNVEERNRLTGGRNQTYFFKFDNTQLRDAAIASIKAQAKYLLDNPTTRIILQGNTDERGSREYNLALGERRSDSVADVLQLQGVPTKQILVVSYGQENPVVPGHNEAAYALNRRVNLKYCTQATGKCLG